MTLAEMLAAYNQAANESQRIRLEDLQNLFGNIGNLGDWQANGQRLGGSGSQYQPSQAFATRVAERPAPPVINPEARRAEIEEELDIIRGRIPTPKGYRVDPSRIKALMLELRELPK